MRRRNLLLLAVFLVLFAFLARTTQFYADVLQTYSGSNDAEARADGGASAKASLRRKEEDEEEEEEEDDDEDEDEDEEDKDAATSSTGADKMPWFPKTWKREREISPYRLGKRSWRRTDGSVRKYIPAEKIRTR